MSVNREGLEKLARICDKRGYKDNHELVFMAHEDSEGKLTATLTVGDVRALLAAGTKGEFRKLLTDSQNDPDYKREKAELDAGTERQKRDLIGDVLRKHQVPFATVIADDIVATLAAGTEGPGLPFRERMSEMVKRRLDECSCSACKAWADAVKLVVNAHDPDTRVEGEKK